MPIALLALAIAAFGIGTTEFVMMGVLPQVASAFDVGIPTAGNLITAYAIGVVVGAPVLTALCARLPRKTVLLAMMSLFVVGNVLFALSPTLELGLVFRFIAGLPHGAFFGAGAIVAAGLVDEGKRGRAVSRMFVGLTLANVVGVPLGTLLGQQVGWRATFAVVGGIGVLAMVAIQLLIPDQPAAETVGLRGELAPFRRPQVWLALAIVTFGLGGVFASMSYIAPILTDVAGFAPSSVTLLLALTGIGMTIGVLVGGKLADRALMPSMYGSLALLGVVLGLFTLTANNKLGAVITLVAIGFAGFMIGPMIQARVMEKAGGNPSMVSAAVQSGFNIANSIGAYFGGMVIAGGFGLLAPNVVGAALSAIGLALAVLSGLLDRRDTRAWKRRDADAEGSAAMAVAAP
ncbi:MAG: MFS transporter [Actinomycetota bacterium]|nr:MFS transporter [Actinomycetota bacterium]